MIYSLPRIEATKAMAARDASDGSPSEIPVYVARPTLAESTRRPGLLLIQEIFGVNEHIQDVARRFATAGFVVVAPDMFYRSGHWISLGYTEMDKARPLAATLKEDLVIGDMKAALNFLTAQPDVDPKRIGVIGYCFGGRAALIAAEEFPDLIKASVIYYGGGIVSDQPNAPVTRVKSIKCSILGFFGALDTHIPRAHVEKLDIALNGAGVRHKLFYYPDAGHGFFCDAREGFHARVAEHAWHRTQRFLHTHLGPVPTVAWEP